MKNRGKERLEAVDVRRRAQASPIVDDIRGAWRELGRFAAGEDVRLPPFEAVRLETGDWWLPPATPGP